METKRITKEELKQKIDRKEDFVVIDLRNPTAYGSSPVKIKGVPFLNTSFLFLYNYSRLF